MLIITLEDVRYLVKQLGVQQFFLGLIEQLTLDFKRWHEFQKCVRIASHYPHGSIELMPITDDEYYAFKYVNVYPGNTKLGKPTVLGLGMLAEVATGCPLLLSEMTLLTAFRTAATSALASSYMAPSASSVMAIIGVGAQSEFQALAHWVAVGCKTIQFFDIDAAAMTKFANNLSCYDITLKPCDSVKEALQGADIITTLTAHKAREKVLCDQWIESGVHINAVGGDSPGKTELDVAIIARSKVVVEYLPQTSQEGEVQTMDQSAIYAELWQLVSGQVIARDSDDDVTVFDSVGFALEDYSMLTYIYQLANKHNVGQSLPILPQLNDPKDLFSLLVDAQ